MVSINTKKNRLIVSLFFLLLLFSNFTLCYEIKGVDEQLKAADSIRSSNSKKFSDILNKLEKKRVHLTKEQAYYLDYLNAYKQSISGDLERAVASYKAIIDSDADLKMKFRANSSIINTFAITQNWTEGLSHLSRHFEILENLPNDETKQTGFIISAMFYNLLGQYELGRKYASIAQNESQNSRTICIANQLAVEAKFKLKQVEVADLEIKQAINSCERENEIIMASQIYAYLAKLHMDNGNNQLAKNLLLENLTSIENSKYSPVIAMYYALLAEIHLSENNLSTSSSYAYKVLSLSNSSGNSPPLVSAYLLLYKIHLLQKSYQEALEYYVKYAEANNAHLEGEKAKHLAFQLAKHQATEQESQIELLNEKNALLTAQQALSEAEVANTRLIIAFLVISLILITLWGGRLYKAHKRIKELAEYDALTGIFNRGHFTHVANSALKYCQNAEQDLSVIIFDLDNFKTVNDSYGHATGDWALKEATKVCKNLGRQNDIFARIGGEEFCILLPSCNIRSAALRAEECRHAIEDIITEASGHDFRITASFGVTDAKTSGFNLEKLLADADEAAYTSKHSGRNRVTVYEVETTPKQAQLDGSWSIS